MDAKQLFCQPQGAPPITVEVHTGSCFASHLLPKLDLILASLKYILTSFHLSRGL